MMAAKKNDKDTTSLVVDVTVPAVNGIALNDIYKTALAAKRDEVPLVSNLSYSIDGTEKKGDNRVYKVRISWADTAQPTDEEPTVDDHIDALKVPTSLPSFESDPTA